MFITGTADQIAELLCGPRQHDEHCKGWRWHLFVRDDNRRYQAVKDEVRKMLVQRRAAEGRADAIEALAEAAQ